MLIESLKAISHMLPLTRVGSGPTLMCSSPRTPTGHVKSARRPHVPPMRIASADSAIARKNEILASLNLEGFGIDKEEPTEDNEEEFEWDEEYHNINSDDSDASIKGKDGLSSRELSGEGIADGSEEELGEKAKQWLSGEVDSKERDQEDERMEGDHRVKRANSSSLGPVTPSHQNSHFTREVILPSRHRSHSATAVAGTSVTAKRDETPPDPTQDPCFLSSSAGNIPTCHSSPSCEALSWRDNNSNSFRDTTTSSKDNSVSNVSPEKEAKKVKTPKGIKLKLNLTQASKFKSPKSHDNSTLISPRTKESPSSGAKESAITPKDSVSVFKRLKGFGKNESGGSGGGDSPVEIKTENILFQMINKDKDKMMNNIHNLKFNVNVMNAVEKERELKKKEGVREDYFAAAREAVLQSPGKELKQELDYAHYVLREMLLSEQRKRRDYEQQLKLLSEELEKERRMRVEATSKLKQETKRRRKEAEQRQQHQVHEEEVDELRKGFEAAEEDQKGGGGGGGTEAERVQLLRAHEREIVSMREQFLKEKEELLGMVKRLKQEKKSLKEKLEKKKERKGSKGSQSSSNNNKGGVEDHDHEEVVSSPVALRRAKSVEKMVRVSVKKSDSGGGLASSTSSPSLSSLPSFEDHPGGGGGGRANAAAAHLVGSKKDEKKKKEEKEERKKRRHSKKYQNLTVTTTTTTAATATATGASDALAVG